MGVDEYANFLHLDSKKIRNELIENLIKEEDYRKKDEKKKEIVKTCNSYKDFCNIVECINMKPIKTYEKKINYEEYVNSRYNTSYCKSDIIRKNNIKNNLAFIKNEIKELSKEKYHFPSNKQKEKRFYELQQFIEILKNNRKNYYAFIRSTYNCDDIKDILFFIKNNFSGLFDYICDTEPKVKLTNEQEKAKESFLGESLILFLYALSQYWHDQNFSLFFNADELNDIRSYCNIILEEIHMKFNQILNSCDEMLKQFHFIKNIFSK